MKKTLSACFQCGLLSALCLGWALPARAQQTPEPDFTQLERVSAQHKPCKRMEKEFQPALRKIEEERRKEGIEAPSYVLWFDDNRSPGYCLAVSYPLVGDNPMILKNFKKEFPEGGYSIRWDSAHRKTLSGDMSSWEGGWDITSLCTTYYDRKNKTYHWMWYRLRERVDNQYMHPNDYEFLFSSTSVPFLERHYRTLLDDLAETAEAGPRRNLLTLQLLQLRAYLRESFNDTAFLESEHKRRGPLMRILDGARIEDLAEGGWTAPDVCTEGERWWPCNK